MLRTSANVDLFTRADVFIAILSSACLRSSISVAVAYQRMTSPASSRSGCNEPAANDTDHPCGALVVRSRMGPSRHRRIAFAAQSLGILRVKTSRKPPTSLLLSSGRCSPVLPDSRTECSVGPNSDDELRYCIDDCSKFSFDFVRADRDRSRSMAIRQIRLA